MRAGAFNLGGVAGDVLDGHQAILTERELHRARKLSPADKLIRGARRNRHDPSLAVTKGDRPKGKSVYLH
jgi:hypothetical protein